MTERVSVDLAALARATTVEEIVQSVSADLTATATKSAAEFKRKQRRCVIFAYPKKERS